MRIKEFMELELAMKKQAEALIHEMTKRTLKEIEMARHAKGLRELARGDAYYGLQMKIGREILSKRRALMWALARS
jgi:hypothetical protein